MMRLTALATVVGIAFSAPMDWVGEFTEPLYGGGLSVCVDAVGGKYVGQGLLSSLGYLRGYIVGNAWSGEYWLAGFEARMGTFYLELDGSGNYDGYLTDKPGLNITTSGRRTSAETPEDLQCFRTQSELLVEGASYDLTGHYIRPDDPYQNWWLIHDGATHTSSYTYSPDQIPGTSYGPIYLNGQVSLDNWYDAGQSEGIELIVARNATTNYNLWWYFARVSDMDYSMKPNGYFGSFVNYLNPTVTGDELVDKAEASSCYILWNEELESDCFEMESDNSDHELLTELLVATLVFTLLTFFMAIAILSLMFVAKRGSLAKQESSSSSGKL